MESQKLTKIDLSPSEVTALNRMVGMICELQRPPYDLRMTEITIPDDAGLVDTGQASLFGDGYDKRVMVLTDFGGDDGGLRGLASIDIDCSRASGLGSNLDFDWKRGESTLIPYADSRLYGLGKCLKERAFSRSYDTTMCYINDMTANDVDDLWITEDNLEVFDVINRLINHDGAHAKITHWSRARYDGERLSNLDPNTQCNTNLRLETIIMSGKQVSTEVKLELVISVLEEGSKTGLSHNGADNEKSMQQYILAMILGATYSHQEKTTNSVELKAGLDGVTALNEASIRKLRLDAVMELGEAAAKLGY